MYHAATAGFLSPRPSKARPAGMGNMCARARVFVALVVLVGWLNLARNVPSWRPEDLTSFLIYLAFSIMAAGFKLRLPGVTGTISVCFFFVFIGIVSLPL